MLKPRERIQPLMPKLAKRNTTRKRNNIESSAFCGSDLRVETVNSCGWMVSRTAPNVMPSVTGRKATEAATAKKSCLCTCAMLACHEQGAVKSETETSKH